MTEWKEFKLGEIANIQNGFAFKSIDFAGNGIPVIKIKNIVPPSVAFEEVSYFDGEIDSNLEKFLIKKGDFLISMTGSTVNQMASAVGKMGKYPFDELALLNQRVGKIYSKGNTVLNEFLYYLMNRKEVQYELAINASGSANQANISPDQIKNLRFRIPPLPTQKAIAEILSSLDDKIELNNQINQNLEALAQALFKQWFVDFEFPNENGEPYKSSGGEMVDSELGEIPKGWKIYNYGDLLETISKTYPLKKVDEVIFLNTGDIQNGKFLHKNFSKADQLPGQAKKSIQQGDILYSEIRPQNKRFAYVHFNAEKFVVSTKLMVLRPKVDVDPLFMYFLLTQEGVIGYLQILAESRSGTFPQITFSEVSTLKIALPEFEEVNSFSNKVLRSYFEHSFNMDFENESLSELRDTLLPKLISGELVVNESLLEQAF
jgi:type I restriction enzyme S subunit